MNTASTSHTRQSAWSSYWKQNALHSLQSSFQGNYAGPIEQFWQQQFNTLDTRQRVLDIGTGNGALPHLICQHHRAAPPRIDAIDLADISPQWLAEQPAACQIAIHFHSGTSAETLPFEGRAFDLIISQFGFEYTDATRAIPELARTLAPGGRISFLMHHQHSRLTDVAREELSHTQWLLSQDGLLDVVDRIIPWFALATTAEGRAQLQTHAAANRDRDAFNTSMRQLTDRINKSPYPDLLEEARAVTGQLLQALQQQPEHVIAAHSSHYRNALGEAQLRYQELVDCALDETRLQRLCKQFEAHGFTSLQTAPIHHENGLLMGWTLTAHQ